MRVQIMRGAAGISMPVARSLLSLAWRDVADAVFQEAVQCLLFGSETFWLEANPDVLIDPETRPGTPMGIHQTVAPLLSYRCCMLNDKRIFLFEQHILDIID
jgi:hypothetical protein